MVLDSVFAALFDKSAKQVFLSPQSSTSTSIRGTFEKLPYPLRGVDLGLRRPQAQNDDTDRTYHRPEDTGAPLVQRC